MNKNKFLNNVIKIMTSRGIMLVSEILLGFVIPKILGVTGYGYFKTYALYTGYSALLHFGFVDGVLLNFAGMDYEKISKEKFRTFSQFFILLQIIVGIVLGVVCTTILPENLRFIGIMLAINTFIINLTSYYQYISQAMQRFTELSNRNILIAVSKIMLVLGLSVLFYQTNDYVSYKIYISFVNVVEGCLLLWYVVTYKDITFGNRLSFTLCKDDIKKLFTSGIALTIAYQVSHLVFILDRQFVSILHTAEVFAIYSFAYNLVSVCTKIISSLSTVLFPMLKQMKVESAMKYYSKAISLMLILSGFVLLGYFPLTKFIEWYLPNYVESLTYLKVILPGLLLSSCVSVIMFTFYKVLDKNLLYFRVSCIVFAVSIICNFIAHMIFGTAIALSWATVLTMIFWYILAERFFVKYHGVQWKRNSGYITLIICFFYISTIMIPSWIVGMLVYAIVYILLSIVFYRNTDVMDLVKKSNKR